MVKGDWEERLMFPLKGSNVLMVSVWRVLIDADKTKITFEDFKKLVEPVLSEFVVEQLVCDSSASKSKQG